MDKRSIELYKRALSEGEEHVYNIRVMVVGHYGVGKTTLTKRLLDEVVDINKRESTNGIDVHVRRCNVCLKTGQWNTIPKDQKVDTVCHRLANLLKLPLDTESKVGELYKRDTEENIDEELTSITSISPDITEQNDGAESVFAEPESESKIAVTPLEVENVTHLTLSSPQDAKDDNIRCHLNRIIENVQHSVSANYSNMADVSIWDFAGQYVFYATHQVFLSRRAVYLLVIDLSKHMEDTVKDDDCFLDSKGVKHLKISEFVDFWLNSIHEFCSSTEVDGPPVVLVGTFANKVEQKSRKETIDEIFYALRSSLLYKATSCHLTDNDFVTDNSVKNDNIDLLKQHIVKVATDQPHWGEVIPAKWITLESIIVKLKDEGLKVLYKDRLNGLNSTLPVPIETKKKELELFLRFHHESGSILYYSDNKLSDTIVLDPQWLIDAFKSLITAKMFCCRKKYIHEKWIKFDNSAILSRELVDAIWKQPEYSVFQEYDEILLEYLEKLGFISKPRQHYDEIREIDYYFAPCVLKTPPPENLLVYSDCKNRRSTNVLCFTTRSRFLPTAVFNNLLASCIDKWPISKLKNKYLMFCGCGVFDLEDNHKLYVYFFDHVINIWITKLSTAEEEPSTCLCKNVHDFVSDFLRNRMRISSGIEIFLRCNHSNIHNNGHVFELENISSKKEVVCNFGPVEHVHSINELIKYWLYSESGHLDELTEKELNRMAQQIGKEYQSLGLELGLSTAEIEHICLDNKATVDKIRGILLKWKDKNKMNATLEILVKAMKFVGIDAETVIEKSKEK